MMQLAKPSGSSTGPRRAGEWSVSLAMVIAGLAGFIAIAADVVCRGRLSQFDGAVNDYFYPQTRWGVALFSTLSGMGDGRIISVAAVAVGAVLLRLRKWRELMTLAGGLVGSALINGVLKNIFHVARPMDHTFYVFPEHPGYSFPSGHTMGAMVMAGLLGLVAIRVWNIRPGGRWIAAAMVGCVALLESFSLVYMGVHYVSDVIGAAFLSLAWLGVMRFAITTGKN